MLDSIYHITCKLFCNHVFDVKHFLIKQSFAILCDYIFLHLVLANYRFSFITWV